jgi:hypothetical protein
MPLGSTTGLGYRCLTMHTISGLRKALGLSTTNQVRNRIESIRDVLSPHIRRGPNNQILVSDEGLALLKRLQDLYDSGLRMSEASDVLKYNVDKNEVLSIPVSHDSASNRAAPTESTQRLVRSLQDEIAFLRNRIAFLEGELIRQSGRPGAEDEPWWDRLKEDLDVA